MGDATTTLLLAAAALVLSACHGGEGEPGSGRGAESGITVPDTSSPWLQSFEGTLVDDAWRLTVLFDTRDPVASLWIHGEPYAVGDVTLALEKQTTDGSVERADGAVPAHATRSYRLRFAFDECEREPPTRPGRWPGLCGYDDGGVRPRRLVHYELLVDVDILRSGAEDVMQLEAACVPASGSGPSCRLRGATATYARPDGARP